MWYAVDRVADVRVGDKAGSDYVDGNISDFNRGPCEVEGEERICTTIGCHAKTSLSVPGEHMVAPDARMECSIVCPFLIRHDQIVEVLPSC